MTGGEFRIAEAYVEVHADAKPLREQIRDLPRDAAPESKKAGSGLGDALSDGMRQSVVRNSPLIATAVGAGLTLGAPVALAGATTLFAGIAALALAQNDQIKAAYADLGQSIKRGAAADAEGLVPVFTRTAARIGTAFDNLRPTLRETFSAIGPQVDTLTGGMIRFAEQGITGAAFAARNAGPAVDGLASLLEKTGAGLEGFFVNLADGSEGGGQSLDALGSIVQSLLPVIGQLLAVGTELGGHALPILASVAGGVADGLGAVLDIVAPLAPSLGVVTGAVLSGVAAWKMYSAVSGGITSLGAALTSASARAGAFTTSVTGSAKAGETLASAGGRVAGALPAAAAALAVVAAQAGVFEAGVNKGTTALLAGGQAQRTYEAGADSLGERLGKNLLAFVSFGTAADVTQPLEATRAKTAALEAAMTPLELAQSKAARAANEHAFAVKTFGENSPQAKAAAEQLGTATDKAKAAADKATGATKSYTQSLTDLSGIMQGIIGSSLSLEQAQNATTTAAKGLTEATRQNGATSNQARDANLQLRQAVDQQAQAAQRQAQAQNASKGETAAAQAGALAYRTELSRLAGDQDGRVRSAALANIDRLGDTELAAFDAANATSGFKTQVVSLPSGRTVRIVADTDSATRNIAALKEDIRSIQGKTVTIRYMQTGNGKNAQIGGVASAGRLATGGPVAGPGSGTSDTAGLFALSNGEHVWTAAEVRAAGGHRRVESLRQAVLDGVAGMRSGGPVRAAAPAERRGRGDGGSLTQSVTVNVTQISGSPAETGRFVALALRSA